jgi:hypothetical protein
VGVIIKLCGEHGRTDGVCPEADDACPDLPLLQCGNDVVEPYAIRVRHSAFSASGFQCESVDDELFLGFRQEPGCLRVVREDEVDGER